uniref:Retroviral polymerase SH3-like domain-containing protein n=1 Tax=Tanacetum cinerariifolium TaxID=118510 RepID=A0A6L2P774_TANCI|nr:hypothetical protein [Tanacetum cinerariifolium]
MRIESINGKKNILVIVNDYSQYTWTHFLRSKDETPEVLKDFLKMIQRNLQAQVIIVQTDRATESLIIPRHKKTSYHVINEKKPTVKHLHIFGCTCYITKDDENLNKIKEKGDPCILVGYSTQSKGHRVYNKRTKLIVESIHINFDELKEMTMTFNDNTSGLSPQWQMASGYDNFTPAPQLQKTSDHNSSKLKIQDHNNEPSSSKLVLNDSPPVDIDAPSLQELHLLFSPLFEEYFTVGNQCVSKSFALSDNSIQQDTQPTLNVQTTTKPIIQPTTIDPEENNIDQAADA